MAGRYRVNSRGVGFIPSPAYFLAESDRERLDVCMSMPILSVAQHEMRWVQLLG